MKTLPDFCVSSQADGFDEFLRVYNEHFERKSKGLFEFYGAKDNKAYYEEDEWTANILTPQQAIALLTAKPLTEGDFELISIGEETVKLNIPTQEESVKGECNDIIGFQNKVIAISTGEVSDLTNEGLVDNLKNF